MKEVYSYSTGPILSASSRLDFGTNIFSKDWDALVILDACRFDAFNEVSQDFNYIDSTSYIYSVGSTSSEWIANTFIRDFETKIKNTVHLSVNGYIRKVLYDREFPEHQYDSKFAFTNWDTVYPSDFLYLEETWRQLESELHNRFDPASVTDRAIAAYRHFQPDHLVVHYNQPHTPYLNRIFQNPEYKLKDFEKDPFNYLRSGGDKSKVWNSYLNEIKYVLSELEILFTNIDVDTAIISADHGESFGKYNIYGHPGGVPLPVLRKVPWAAVNPSDERTREPDLNFNNNTEVNIEDHLTDLGYK